MKTKRMILFGLVLLFLGTALVFSQSFTNSGRWSVVGYQVNGVNAAYDFYDYITFANEANGNRTFTVYFRDGRGPSYHHLTNRTGSGANNSYDVRITQSNGAVGTGTARTYTPPSGDATYEYTIVGHNTVTLTLRPRN